MRIGFACACAMGLLIGIGGPGNSQATTRSRILRPVDSAQVVAVRGTAHPMARPQFDHGRVKEGATISATLTFRLSPAQQADLDELLKQQQDRTSPSYHKWLTPEQYALRFGMSSSDLAKVAGWLQSQGLKVESIGRNHNEITFSGSVGQVESALKTELHQYIVNGEQHFANATDVAFPSAFSSQVVGVRGLDDFRPKPRVHSATPRFTSSISGNHFVVPGDFVAIYNLKPLYNQGLDGAGQTIAVVGQTAIRLTDVQAFRSASSLPKFDPTFFLVPNTGTSQIVTSDESEADLDVQWAGGVAPNANVLYVYVGNSASSNVFDALQYSIINNVAPVISISYGNCEANLGNSFVLTMRQWAQQANAQGQTISGPAGDSGAADCDFNVTSATNGLAVDVPASIPEVTGVGGSEFTGDAAATVVNGCASDTTYWSGSCSTTSGSSALQYIPETTWNDTTASIAAGGDFAAGGGGVSTIFSKPSWQTGSGVPNDGKRDVPDVTLNASNFHDPALICSEGSCVNGFRDSSGNLTGVGGTSVGAPSFAGIVAILNQATGSSNGNVNPALYTLAGTSAFHDITSGTNKVPCTSGSTNCPSGTTSIGYSAGAGYDLVTGVGSPDTFNLVTAWPSGLATAQAYVVAASPTAIKLSAAGQSGSATVLAAGTNGFAGTVSFTCSVSSTTAGVGCSLSSPSVSIDSANTSQRVTVNLTTTAASASNRSLNSVFWACTLLLPAFVFSWADKKSWRSILQVLTIAVLGVSLGCGGGSGNSQQQQTQGTPAGTYTVTITGTSGSTSQSTNISLSVQ